MTARTGIRRLLARFDRVRAVVVGDLVADEFIYGKVSRVSREAPVLILGYDSTEVLPGGAGNAAANAAAMGARVEVVGLAGRDAAGARLVDALKRHVPSVGVTRVAGYATPVKTRILAGGVHSTKQQVVRIDRAGGHPSRAMIHDVERRLAAAIRRADVVIISDYGTGLISAESWRRALSRADVKTPPLVLVDSRYALSGFAAMTACTPNESEVEALLGVRIGDDPDILESAGRTLLERLKCQAVLITRGSRGMALFEPRKRTDHISIVGSDEVADVTGAGDTVIAAFALALAAGAPYGEAARLANVAGGLVVMKRGTATVSREEILAALDESPSAVHHGPRRH